MKLILFIIILYFYDKLLFFITNKYNCFKYKNKQKKGCHDWSCKDNLICPYSDYYGMKEFTFKDLKIKIKNWWGRLWKKNYL